MDDHPEVMAFIHKRLIQEIEEANKQKGGPFSLDLVEANFSFLDDEQETPRQGYIRSAALQEKERK